MEFSARHRLVYFTLCRSDHVRLPGNEQVSETEIIDRLEIRSDRFRCLYDMYDYERANEELEERSTLKHAARPILKRGNRAALAEDT